MKIAVYHELPQGGARQAVNQMSDLLKIKHKVDLYSIRHIQRTEKFSYTKVYHTPFVIKKWSGNDWKTRFYKDTIELYRLYKISAKIAEQIKSRNYDIIFIHASELIEAPFLLQYKNKNKIFYLHDPYYRYVYEPEFSELTDVSVFKKIYESVNRQLKKILDRSNALKSDHVIANSNFSKKLFEKTYKKKAITVRLGVDTNFFKPKRTKKIYDVLFIGSKSRIDGYDTLLKLRKKLSANIKFKSILIEDEYLTKSQILKLYHKTIIVVCLSRNEPLGLVPLEAMASGALVVATSEGGHRETIINGKSGFLVRRNADEIAKTVNLILDNSSLVNNITLFARKHVVDNWSIKGTVKNLEQTFNSFL